MKVAVADSVFPNLDPTRAVLRAIDATLELAQDPTPEAIVRAAAAGQPPRNPVNPDVLRRTV